MQNIKKVLRALDEAIKEIEVLTGKEISEAIPGEVEEAIVALSDIQGKINTIFMKLSPIRNEAMEARIKLETQIQKSPP